MRITLIGLLLMGLLLGALTVATAAKPKIAPPVPVTVAVEGLHCQACVDELKTDLGKLPGVTKLEVTQEPGQVTAKLDEKKISISAFVRAIADHPQAMDPDKTYGAQLVSYIDTVGCAKQEIMCDECFTEIPKVLEGIKGIETVTLDSTGKIATISFLKDAKVTTRDITTALGKSPLKFRVQYTAPVVAKPGANTQNHQTHQGMGDSCH